MIFNKIQSIITEVMIMEKDDVTRDSLLTEELLCNEIDMQDIMRSLEDEFDVNIKDINKFIDQCEKVQDIVDLLMPYVRQKELNEK